MNTDNESFELTDLGNAERFVALFKTDVRYCAKLGRWLRWNNSAWEMDETGAIDRMAKTCIRHMKGAAVALEDKWQADQLWKHAQRSESNKRIKDMIERASKESAVQIAPTELDAKPMLLNVRNGIVELVRGKLLSHERSYYLSKIAPVDFNPDAACPQWQTFLSRITDHNESLIGYLQRIAGLSLTGDASVQELFIYHGPGANGKSVWLDTIAAMLGDYAAEAPPSLLTARVFDEHPTEIADLAGKRLVIASETEDGAKLRVSLVKKLTGNARIKARKMRQDFFEFPRTHKLVLVTNNRPTIRETTNALWRRVKLIPFNVTIPAEEQDPQLLDKLKAEWSGILAWAVRGCLDWQKHGMQTPNEVTIATEDYRCEQDPLADYLAERCVHGDGIRTSRAELYQDFQSYSTQLGDRHPMDRAAFFALIRRVPRVEESQWKPAGHTIPVRGFTGLGLAFLDEKQRNGNGQVAGSKW